jgi:hypothetical protein
VAITPQSNKPASGSLWPSNISALSENKWKSYCCKMLNSFEEWYHSNDSSILHDNLQDDLHDNWNETGCNFDVTGRFWRESFFEWYHANFPRTSARWPKW